MDVMLKKMMMLLGMVAILAGCSGGVQSGSLESKFGGVATAEAISPTAVRLTWVKKSTVTEYQIFEMGSGSILGTSVFENITIYNLDPNTSYTFKVVGLTSNGVEGVDREISVRTWPRFTGVEDVTAFGGTELEVKWNYAHTPLNYLVFVGIDAAPTAANTNNWKTATASVSGNSYRILNAQPSKTYYVVVHAKYREGEVEQAPKMVSIRSNVSFTTPIYTLSAISIGALPFITVDPVVDVNHTRNGFKTQAFWNGAPVSDPMTGKGTLVFSESAGLPIGKVENISLKFEYGSGANYEFKTIEGLSTYIKGTSPHKELPQNATLPNGAAYFGKAMVAGDFNCDGAEDLAVGVPDISIAKYGVTSPGVGAVFIYYSVKSGDTYRLRSYPDPVQSPINPGVDPQVITLSDLTNGAAFGSALAVGNLNGDKSPAAPCMDLAVGTPGYHSSGLSYSGLAFVYFGSTKGLRSTTTKRDMPTNAETCDGKVEGAACVGVVIEPSFSFPTALTDGAAFDPYPDLQTGYYRQFGYALSFIGDFDGNGYDDLAIGAPGAPWFGKFPNLAGDYLLGVGMVGIVTGSKYGMSKTRYNGHDISIMPVFPPVPQANMRFGSSIAGGADVDGKFRVRLGDGTLAGGGDMVIGAPGFTYNDYRNPTGGLLTSPYGNSPDVFSIANVDGTNAWIPGPVATTGLSLSDSHNYYGFPQNGTASVGIAFLYYGLSRGSAASSSDFVTDMDRNNWWSCGSRGMGNKAKHFSCLARSDNFSFLYPRDANSRGFGSAVAMIGDASRYKTSSVNNDLVLNDNTAQNPNAYNYFSDSNGDGFADVVVFAPTSTVSGKSNVGQMWQFFGNGNKFFGVDLYNLESKTHGSGDPPLPGHDFKVNNPTCASFAAVNGTTMRNCAPNVTRSTSLAGGALLGQNQAAVAVADITGDGLKDVIVGAPGENTVGATSGAVLVFPSGSGTGVNPSYKKLYTQETSANDRFGTGVAAGNFNGDYVTFKEPAAITPTIRHVADVFGGSPNDGSQAGAIGTVHGFVSTGGVSLPSVMSDSSDGYGGKLLLFEKLASFSNYGVNNIAIVGDINGDGYDDAVTKKKSYLSDGSLSVQAVVFYGSKRGLITKDFCLANKDKIFVSSVPDSTCYASASPLIGVTKDDIPLPQMIAPTNMLGEWFGRAFPAGDVNNDGYDDVLFAASGNLVLYFGGRGGLQNVVNPTWVPSNGDPQRVTQKITLSSGLESDTLGLYSYTQQKHLIHGDFNGDGFADILIGAPNVSSEPMNGGTHPDGAGGWNCVNAECLNGTAAPYHGMVWVFYGSHDGYQTPALQKLSSTDILAIDGLGTMNMIDTEAPSATKPCDLTVPGQPASCRVAYMRNPVWENIPYGYDNLSHFFGLNVLAMKVNSDIYDDALVGSPYYQDLSCSTASTKKSRYGRIFVFYGSETGLVAAERRAYYNKDYTGLPCPVSAIATNIDDRDAALGIRFAPTESVGTLRALSFNNVTDNRQLGALMSVVGDVNGDGFEDLVVTNPAEDSTGTGYLYYGPLCPLDNYPDANSFIAGAGNLNKQVFYSPSSQPAGATGYSIYTNWEMIPPLATVGCEASANMWKPAPMRFQVLGADPAVGDEYGYGMNNNRAGHGDFNGDGLDDILIGSYESTDNLSGTSLVGNGVVLFGSKVGLSVNEYPTTSLLTTSDSTEDIHRYRPFYIRPKVFDKNSRFFMGNISTGDVNNDGTVDYMITSPFYNGEGDFKGIYLGTFFLFY